MASNKLRNAMADEGEGLEIDMSPMIDMVFLLLIFFIVNATMIIVKMDPKVKPPIASHSKPAADGNGRIVINIYENGDLFDELGVKLNEDEDIFELVKKEKEIIDGQGYEPKLHLRGDKGAVFKYCRQVIRMSAKAGVDQVLFATYAFERK